MTYPSEDLVPHLTDYALLLSAIRTALNCEAVIVGGMLRDMDNGAPIKDVDIFCFNGTSMWSRETLAVALRTLPGLEVTSSLQMTYFANDECNLCVTATVFGIPHEVQIILASFNSTFEAIDRVDFGICQIGYDGTTLTRTPQYLADQKAKLFRLVRCGGPEDRKRSMKRYERFKLKYPEWGFEDWTGRLAA